MAMVQCRVILRVEEMDRVFLAQYGYRVLVHGLPSLAFVGGARQAFMQTRPRINNKPPARLAPRAWKEENRAENA